MTLLRFYITLLLTDLPVLASRLRTGGTWSSLLLYEKFLWFVFTRKFLLRGRALTFQLKYNGCPFTLSLDYPSQLAPLVEIYVHKEYEHRSLGEVKVILDLGANYGDSAIYFHTLYPKARIYAIEPAPASYEQLKRNTAQFPVITPVQAIVSDTSGMREFYINETGALGNSLTQRGDATAIPVPSYTLPDLFTLLQLPSADIIKFDVEGAEEAIFDASHLSRFASMYIGEVHEDLMKMPKKDFLGRFSGFSLDVRPLKNPLRSILVAKNKA